MDNIQSYVDDVIRRAANPEHEWDIRAIDWPGLGSDSVVVEVGGYQGRWSLQIANKYSPKLYVFEPQQWAAEVCSAVLGDKGVVLRFGLGIETTVAYMSNWGTDGCTFDSTGATSAMVFDIREIFSVLNISRVDLMMMNIEGYEYKLLPHMINAGMLPDRLVVQWHTFADPSGERFDAITQAIEITHDRIWDYGFTLMAWQSKSR